MSVPELESRPSLTGAPFVVSTGHSRYAASSRPPPTPLTANSLPGITEAFKADSFDKKINLGSSNPSPLPHPLIPIPRR